MLASAKSPLVTQRRSRRSAAPCLPGVNYIGAPAYVIVVKQAGLGAGRGLNAAGAQSRDRPLLTIMG